MTRIPPSNRGKKITKINSLAFAQLVLHMVDGMHTCEQLAELTGLHYVTVLQYTRDMWQAGACFIDHWEQDNLGRDALKVYKIGHGKDAKRHRQSDAQIARRYRAKKRHAEIIQATAGTTPCNA